MITICTKGSAPLFLNHEYTLASISLLADLCEQYNFSLYCYCFMPDHIHFIVSVRGGYSILNLIAMFKSLASKSGKGFGLQTSIFQKRFYDHFLRSNEDLNDKIRYIIENPFRKGLVNNWEGYPYSTIKDVIE